MTGSPRSSSSRLGSTNNSYCSHSEWLIKRVPLTVARVPVTPRALGHSKVGARNRRHWRDGPPAGADTRHGGSRHQPISNVLNESMTKFKSPSESPLPLGRHSADSKRDSDVPSTIRGAFQ